MSLTQIIDRYRQIGLARAAAALLLGAALAAAAASHAASSAADGGLEIRDAWIRWLPSGLPAAAYLTLVNHSDRPVALVSASSDAYHEISLHQSMTHQGMSHMAPVPQISVPAHSTLRFSSGGYHLMLMRPTRPLAPGDHVRLTLHFADGAERGVSFEVRAPNGSAPAHSQMAPMPGMQDMHPPPAPPAPR